MSGFRMEVRIILKLVVLLSVIMGINYMIYLWVSPPWSWGSDKIELKRKYLQESKKPFDVLFIGDSKIGQGIIPSEFDKYVKLYGREEVHSFNFGIGSLMPPESYFLLDNLIEKDHLRPKVVILELSDIPVVGPKMIHTLRGRYWYTPSWFVFTIRSVFFSWRAFTSSMPMR